MSAYALLGYLRLPQLAIAAECLQAVTCALFVPAGVQFVEQHTPAPHLVASMQALFSMVSIGVGIV